MNLSMDNRIGIGVDIENIDRFVGLDRTQGRSLLDKIFTQSEIEYCYSKREPASHLAARFAGKESVVKATYSMGKSGINYRDIEIVNNKDGVPEVRIDKPGFHNIQVKLSLSHCSDKAIAFVIAVEAE